MKTRKWNDLRAEKMQDPNWELGYKAARARLENDLAAHEATLVEIRQARALTQVEVARLLGTSQSEVSRIEHQADLILSTVRAYIESMGGELHLLAHFPDQNSWAELAIGDLLGQDDDTRAGV